MTDVDTEALLRGVAFLNAKLEAHLCAEDPPAGSETPEKIAKAISALIKALKDVDAYNQAMREKDESTRYISYEDYPPLRPADRDAIIKNLETAHLRVGVDPQEIETPEGS